MKRIRKLIVVCAFGAVIMLAFQLWPRAIRLKASYRGHMKDVYSLDFHPDGQLVASGGGDGVRVWEFHTQRELWRTRDWPPWEPPATVKFITPELLLYSDASRGIVLVQTSGWVEQQVLGSSALQIIATSSSDGRWIAGYFKNPRNAGGTVDTPDRTRFRLVVWDRNDLATTYELPVTSMGEIVCLKFHPTHRHLAAIGRGGSVHWWDFEKQQLLGNVSGPKHRIASWEHRASSCTFAPSGKTIQTPIAVIEYPSGRVEKRNHSTGSPYSGTVVAVSPDGQRIATGRQDAEGNALLALWSPETKSPLSEFTVIEDAAILSMCFSPDGRFLAIGGAPRTGWDRGLNIFPWPLGRRPPDFSVKVWQIRRD
jgi:WD40 repeat protein